MRPGQDIKETIVADTANSIDASAMEATAASVIVRLAQFREVASHKADAYVATGGNDLMDHGHWHRLWMALTDAIVCHVPTSLSDVLLVLEGVSSIRDLMENTDCTDQERRDCSEATTIAILNCLPVVSDHASEVARVLSASGVKVARRRIAIREGRHHG